ncbi:MAG: V-type ATPase [Synergistales bacterium 54_24]|nr:MAG: V-type ATPase [Synergistales bacterium 54_24]HAF50729.1 V-type ATP synthase subunit I [Synergistaceae bacterium]
MAIVELKHVDLLVHSSVENEVAAEIQRLGFCEPISLIGEEDRSSHASKVRLYDERLSDVRFILRFLEPYYQGKEDKIAWLLGERPKRRWEELVGSENQLVLQDLSQRLRSIERRMTELRSELSNLQAQKTLLKRLNGFPYPLAIISGTDTLSAQIGTIGVEDIPPLLDLLKSRLDPQKCEWFIAPPQGKDKDTLVVILYLKELEPSVAEISEKCKLSSVELPRELKGKVENEIRGIDEKEEKLLSEREGLELEIQNAAEHYIPAVRELHDYYTTLKDRYQALSEGRHSDQTSFLSFWVPLPCIDLFKQKLARWSDMMEMGIYDPLPDEEPPIILTNPRFIQPFEPLTTLYGLPAYGGVDPTPHMSPYFCLFFGFCLGDGVYGIALALLSTYALLRYDVKGGLKRFLTLFLLCGLSSVVIGALTGSWAGNAIDAFSILRPLKPLKDAVMIGDPTSDPLSFLAVALALGIVQILYGLSLAFVDAWRKGDHLGAVGDKGSWIVLIVGLLLWGGEAMGYLGGALGIAGKVLAIAGAITIVATQGRTRKNPLVKTLVGLISLYNITSYLGDTLSYSRLLALGMASAVVGMIINTLSGLLSGIPLVGPILGVCLFIMGHIFSLAVNALGAFVHSLRLQYVEFFSKFYSASGRPFRPLCYEMRYISLVDEEIK